MECGVGSVECGVWSVECGVWSVECGIKSNDIPYIIFFFLISTYCLKSFR